MNKNLMQYIDILPEIQTALDNGEAVVALESTIISHGMEYPLNVECARRCEEIIREEGAVPATIAIIQGRIKVGLTYDELEYFGTEKGIRKVSRRDLAMVVANGKDGATTVAGTMIISEMVGISIFATGGIGGVHRKAQETFDISADLEELSKTSVAVICAGAKSILDIALTLEVLETKGVPTIGYGTDDFPAFYTRSSGYGVDERMNDPETVAAFLSAKWNLGINGGVIIANPIPVEAEMDEAYIAAEIDKALAQSELDGVKGKNVTPYLLKHLFGATDGKSLSSNLALVYNNARVGAKIAKAYAK
jgi:pseudouridine-5'-phosphate glycosidase